MLRQIGDIVRGLFERREVSPNLWIDPTGVLLKQVDGECPFCDCPGWECVDHSTCPRAKNASFSKMANCGW